MYVTISPRGIIFPTFSPAFHILRTRSFRLSCFNGRVCKGGYDVAFCIYACAFIGVPHILGVSIFVRVGAGAVQMFLFL